MSDTEYDHVTKYCPVCDEEYDLPEDKEICPICCAGELESV